MGTKDKKGTINEKSTIKNFFEEGPLNDDKPIIETLSLGQTEARIKQLDHEARNQLLLETLSPHLSSNEKQKRDFKIELMHLIKWLIILQLIFVAVPILLTFAVLCIKLLEEIPVEIVVSIFSFLKYYITAIIAELLAMLFFIVRFVFDKSIVDLVREMIKK